MYVNLLARREFGQSAIYGQQQSIDRIDWASYVKKGKVLAVLFCKQF